MAYLSKSIELDFLNKAIDALDYNALDFDNWHDENGEHIEIKRTAFDAGFNYALKRGILRLSAERLKAAQARRELQASKNNSVKIFSDSATSATTGIRYNSLNDKFDLWVRFELDGDFIEKCNFAIRMKKSLEAIEKELDGN